MYYVSIITFAAQKVGVSAILLLAICTQETHLKNTTVENDMGTPSFGVCQVKEGAAKMVGFRGNAKDLKNAKTNAYWAAKYLKYQLDRYNGNVLKSIAAYNSGTYVESKKKPGCPRNLAYVNKVKSFIKDENIGLLLECGE